MRPAAAGARQVQRFACGADGTQPRAPPMADHNAPPPTVSRQPRPYFFSLKPAGTATSAAATSFDTLSVSLTMVITVVWPGGALPGAAAGSSAFFFIIF